MISFRSLISLIYISLGCFVYGKEDGELKAVVVLFRHGDRSPLSSWPNDKYLGDSTLWPDGYGQLNNMGKERHYLLGQWFRNRYDGFLPSRYNRSDIYVRSTDVDRTLMSAASNLAGLYPPSDDQVWNEKIPWQAIPIHTVPEDNDPILADHTPCPRHDRLKETLLNSAEFQQFFQENEELFQNVSEVTGFPQDEMSLKSFSTLFSTLTIYKGYNLTLPGWTEYYWPEIKSLAAKNFQISTYTEDLARLRSGPFIDYIIEYFNAVINQIITQDFVGDKVQKFLMLSAHDTTIADRINAMGVYTNAVPEFASSVIWELKTKNGQKDKFYINMYFKNSTDFSSLVIPGCDFNCDINDFVEVLEPITVPVDQWTQECYEN